MPHQDLFRKLFSDGISNTDRDFLAKVAAEHPYFSAAHFFLLKATAPGDPEYRKIAARTALHFNNPYYLQFQLHRQTPAPSTRYSMSEEQPAAIAVVESTVVTQESALSKEADPVISEKFEFNGTDIHPQENHPQNPAEPGKVAPATDELLFEPLHTTDYFASQGIKLSEEVQQGDKLGKQLRSFTDWLKTMKKVNQGKSPEVGSSIDPMVQKLADRSNKEEEVLTESMAEVYIQQGKFDKAVGVYNKLSLLNPSKTAYFAAKIEVIKNK